MSVSLDADKVPAVCATGEALRPPRPSVQPKADGLVSVCCGEMEAVQSVACLARAQGGCDPTCSLLAATVTLAGQIQ